jgi:hypothetical protein
VSAVALPPLLIAAGCCLCEAGRQLAVLDQAGNELARGPKKQLDWIWSASTAALIERRAAALGVCYELHSQELLFRLWSFGASEAAVPWLSFDDALAWLTSEEVARRRRLVCAEPITAQSELEATEWRSRERRRGRAVPVGAHRLDELQQRGKVASGEPITRTQEPQSAGRSVIEHLGRRRVDRTGAATGQAASRPQQHGRAALPEPITSALEPQSAERSVIGRWWGARSSPGRAVWARDGPTRGRGAARSGSITPTYEPQGTTFALLVQRAMHFRCGRWP